MNNERPTPETDAASMSWYGNKDAVQGDFARELERERDKARKLLAQYSAEREHNAMQALAHKADADSMRDAIKVSLIRAYTAGYQHGHESTVDGGYIPVHHSEKTDFHAENIHQMLCDGSLPELQPFLNN